MMTLIIILYFSDGTSPKLIRQPQFSLSSCQMEERHAATYYRHEQTHYKNIDEVFTQCLEDISDDT